MFEVRKYPQEHVRRRSTAEEVLPMNEQVQHTEESLPRALDHVGIVVTSTETAVDYFAGRLGFPVTWQEVFEQPPVRLTYLDCGNAFLQLIEPLGPSPLADVLAERGEGVHHVCFASAEPLATAARLADAGASDPVEGRGRGLRSAFVPGVPHHGVLIECNELQPRSE